MSNFSTTMALSLPEFARSRIMLSLTTITVHIVCSSRFTYLVDSICPCTATKSLVSFSVILIACASLKAFLSVSSVSARSLFCIRGSFTPDNREASLQVLHRIHKLSNVSQFGHKFGDTLSLLLISGVEFTLLDYYRRFRTVITPQMLQNGFIFTFSWLYWCHEVVYRLVRRCFAHTY